MGFRPSVLPDRGNDIISTFARSFESARQLVRQDQFDRRAATLQEQEIRLRQQDIEDRDFQAEQRRTRPGTFEPGTFPGAARDDLAEAFTPLPPREQVGAGGLFGAVEPPVDGAPRLAVEPSTFLAPQAAPPTPRDGGRRRLPGVQVAPSQIFEQPQEPGTGGVGVIEAQPDFLREPVMGFFGEPEDVVTERGGRRFSQQLADQIAADEVEAATRRAAAVTEDLPAARRARTEEARERGIETRETAEEASERKGQATALRNLFPDELGDIRDDDVVIAQGAQLSQERLRRVPTGASTAAAANRIERGRATVLSVFERKVAAARSAAGRREPTPQEMLAQFQFERSQGAEGAEFDPFADIDQAAIMEESITAALTAGTITPEQATDMSANASQLLTAAGVVSLGPGGGGGGPLSPEDIAFFLEDATGTIEQRVAQWEADGLDAEAVAQLRSAAGG